MADIRRVTDDFAVAPQIAIDDIPAIAQLGYRAIISNRPDDEAPGQPTAAQVEAAAKAAGLGFVHAPFAGQPTPAAVEAIGRGLAGNQGPVLAYCRSGTRSITAWALSQAASGARQPDALVSLAAEAGYDLSPLKGLLLKSMPR